MGSRNAYDQLDTLSSADALAALYSSVNKAASIRQGARMEVESGRQKASAYAAQAGSQLAAGQATLIGAGLSAVSSGLGAYAKIKAPITRAA